ncbi:hypothetical protein LF1_09710 [Rubripirellula obstinata]|uniref:Uncharacterized protein n=1 Tax=Rubripirellula obstinata TaxID=406547 RepID=A0A5B1CE07_9BACT|nr:hypothetical protein [Rubripirellula obstinata]KAA1258451.1 hypothetical protein LF1_09710 [Rubripirellula obstinata]
MFKTVVTLSLWFGALFTATSAEAQGRTLARLFWQDDSSASLQWGDLKKNAEGFHLAPATIDQFPELDPDEQSLVQMRHDDGLIIVGVHDNNEGTFGSGWVAIESGAIEEPHGDHSHWKFNEAPSVAQQIIDETQGNPAHVYRYGKSFVLAIDKNNGFTIASADSIRQAKTAEQAAAFFDGGSGHITLAVEEDRVAYATWIAPVGENAGRIDVIGLGENSGQRYTIACPTGGLHGATINSGKAFFAPSEGVCWVEADREMSANSETVTVNHLSLGKDADDKPLRTGAFANLKSHVIFTSGKGDQAKLCVLNAADQIPALIEVSLDLPEGQSVMSPIPMQTRSHGPLACMFAESKEKPETDELIVVALDPNRDGDFSDAVIKTTIAVGRNDIRPHAGHHDAVLLPDGRRIAITNPGDQSIWIVSLADFSVQAKLSISGTPTRLLAIGG